MMMPIAYEKLSDREIGADEAEFRRKLSDLVDEALNEGACPMEISLALELAHEDIDSGLVVASARA
jgi:hypothetical protein